MANNRIFYACQAVAICKMGHTPTGGASATCKFMKGIQSVGITTNFTLDQAYEMGQIQIYQNSEEIADVEVTLEKVIDGEPLIYPSAAGAVASTNLVSAGNNRCDVYLAVYADSVSAVADATPVQVCMCSGMYVSSVSYTFPVDGNATESVTLVGNDKFWSGRADSVANPATSFGDPDTGLSGSDTPASGLVRRTNVDVAGSTLPSEVITQSSSATSRHIASISVSADFGRDNILELGRFGPYFRYATYPFEVTSEFEVTATSGDLVNVSGSHPNLSNHNIIIKDSAGTVLDLGTQNKLSSVSYSGGDTGGGNATITYSYSTFNDLKVHGGKDSNGYYS